MYKSIIEMNSQNGIEGEEKKQDINFGFKVGYRKDKYFGVKIRAGREGNYFTHLWDSRGELAGILQANYLTYYRTASLLLLYPYFKLGQSAKKIMIIGSGNLGMACAHLSSQLFINSKVEVVSINGRWKHSIPENMNLQNINITKLDKIEGDYDILLTCTNSIVPLSLEKVKALYIGVGGAVNNRRREIPNNLLELSTLIFSDNTTKSKDKCGDLFYIKKEPLHLSRVLKDGEFIPNSIGFICGTGNVDIDLALEAIRSVENERKFNTVY